MILALDVGNSQIYAGVFHSPDPSEKPVVTFRKTSKTGFSSDEMGIFLKTVLRENEVDPKAILQIVLCSVVPDVVHSIRNCCRKYFGITPFILQAGVRTGLKIKYRNPLEVGADRIANAIAGIGLFPNEDLIIIDFGTATTFDAITREKDYLGGAILAGVRISMDALESRTSKLPSVEIVMPENCVARSTVESIQSGLYYGNIGAIREIVSRMTQEVFHGRTPKVIGTGGLASLFASEGLFNVEYPELVLRGLLSALQMNDETFISKGEH